MVETADKLTDAEAGLQQYLLLVGALRSLAQRAHDPQLTLDSYLLRALSIAGWAPSFGDCAVTGAPARTPAFVVQLGGVVADEAAPPGAPRLDPATLDLLAALLTGDWATAEAMRRERPAIRRAASSPPTPSGTSSAGSGRCSTSTAPPPSLPLAPAPRRQCRWRSAPLASVR